MKVLEETAEVGRAIRCRVEVVGGHGSLLGMVELVRSDGLQIHLLPSDGQNLLPGADVNLKSDAFPIGPIHTTASVTSITANKDYRGRPVACVSLQFTGWNEAEKCALQARLKLVRPVIVAYGVEDLLEEAVSSPFRVVNATCADEVLAYHDKENVAVMVFGPRMSAIDVVDVLKRCWNEFPYNHTLNVILSSDTTKDFFQDFVDEDRIFYLGSGSISKNQLSSILTAAVSQFSARLQGGGFENKFVDLRTDRILELCVRLSEQGNVVEATSVIPGTVCDLLRADHARCLLYDRQTESLVSVDPVSGEQCYESAATGLTGYLIRTTEGIRVERIGLDPRCDLDIDNPLGNETARFIAEPIADIGGQCIGVVSAVRGADSRPFSDEDQGTLRLLVARIAPILASQIREHGPLTGTDGEISFPNSQLFRKEAIDRYTHSAFQEGELLLSLPTWLRRSHLLIIGLVFGGLAYASLARVHEIATGPVLIRARSKVTVTASVGGLVRSVAVSVGDRVHEGDLLVRLQSTPGDSLVDRIKKELRAPSNGTVSDIRVRPGQSITLGDQIVSVVDEASGNELISFLPGSYAPQIRPGMLLVLKLEGYPDSNEQISIDNVSSEILGPQEAVRYAGKESAGALSLSGPVLITRSLITSSTFAADGRSYRYHDGMVGEASVSVRSSAMIVELVPGLKKILAHPGDVLKIQ